VRRIELDFLEKHRFSLKKYRDRIFYFALLFFLFFFIVGSLFFYTKAKSQERKLSGLSVEVSQLEVKVKKQEKGLKLMKAKIVPEIEFLNSGLERKAFNYTEAFYLLEKALPSKSYITRITISSRGKVVSTGVFSSSSAIKKFVEELSQGGKYQVYLTREEMKGGRRVANIAWDLKGGK